MRIYDLNLCALLAGCITIAACSQATGFSRLQYTPNGNVADHVASPLHRRNSALYSFGENPDGALPTAPLIDVAGTLYGTTSRGGIYDRGTLASYGGTVFSITTKGNEKVLHSFGGGKADGLYPEGPLINVKGTLYGTTPYGGNAGCDGLGCGTVFSITTSGSEKILHVFGTYPDGSNPVAGLINVGGKLYGTTALGGTGCAKSGCGTVFRITTSGAEKVLYSFKGDPDGETPTAPLIHVKGMLYGATANGGIYNESGCNGFGCGTVFTVTKAGKERVLHSFGNGTDGRNPLGGLVDVGGTLYGTTFSGGGYNVSRGGYGTVFSITARGKEKVLYSFGYLPDDGQYPYAGLLNVKGTLYGTNDLGGAHKFFGTVFSVTTGGNETVLRSFGGDRGAGPRASLIDVKGKLYGTTWKGGDKSCVCGTVFVLSP